jgi:hypothetical protein
VNWLARNINAEYEKKSILLSCEITQILNFLIIEYQSISTIFVSDRFPLNTGTHFQR